VSRPAVWVARAGIAVLAASGGGLLVLAAAQHRPPPSPAASAAGSVSPFQASRVGPPVAVRPASLRSTGPALQRGVLGGGQDVQPLGSALPQRLKIPALGVSAPVVGLGLNADGSLQVPTAFSQTGWYRASPTPGALGPAVIAGHVDSAAGGPAVFYRLAALHPGDHVEVERADRRTAVFTVTGVREFGKDQFPTQLVYANTRDAALRLVTCGGSFDAASGHYRDDVVVFATLTGSMTG